MFWSLVQTIGRQGINFVIFYFLAVLLSPEDFGLLGMAMAFIAFIQMFSEIGFGAALIQRREIKPNHFSTTFFINIATGLILTIIGIFLSWPCAFFFKTPAVQPILAVLSLGFLISSISLTQTALAQRELRFRDLAIRDLLSSLLGGIAGIAFAILKFGVWSLVIQSLISTALSAILLWKMSQWRPLRKEFSFQYAKELWPYSSKIFTFNLFKYFAQNTDKLIIGHFLGPMALGLYTFAYKIMIYPTSALVGSIGNYLFPRFSEIQENIELVKSSYLFLNKVTIVLVTPVVVIIAFISPIVIPIIFGKIWEPAVPLIHIFAFLAIVSPWISHTGQLMKALNRPVWLLYWAIFITFFIGVTMIIGSNFGITGAAAALVITYFIGIPVNFLISFKLIHSNSKDVLNIFKPALLSGLLMGLILYFLLQVRMIYGHFIIPISILSVVISYFGILILIDKPFCVVVYRKFILK